MKKLMSLSLILFIVFTSNVFAAENKLYFTENGNRLYYNSSLLDEDVFMKHVDMIPGSSYVDTLRIENATSKTYKLYFQVKPRKQSAAAENLLNHIDMNILIDGVLIYDGKVKGLDYNNQGVNLQNAIEIGDFTPGKTVTMKVYTRLSTSYTNPEENDLAYIDWSFYGQWYDEVKEESQVIKIEKSPKTGISTNLKLYSMVILSAVAVTALIYIIDKKIKKAD